MTVGQTFSTSYLFLPTTVYQIYRTPREANYPSQGQRDVESWDLNPNNSDSKAMDPGRD